MITFILAWCALSLVGTLFALSLIRTGKQRQPDTDETRAAPLSVPVTYKP